MKRRRMTLVCVLLGVWMLFPGMGYGFDLDRFMNSDPFHLWLPSGWDPVGETILRPIENKIPNLDLSGLFRTRLQYTFYKHPFMDMTKGQGEGTHPLMWAVNPNGSPLNSEAGDFGEKIKYKIPVWEQLFELEANYRIANNWRFNLIFNQTYNAAYDVDGNVHHFFSKWQNVNEWRYYRTVTRMIKDCWLDYKSPVGAPLDYDLRIGKQFVVWGKVDGARVMDIINPEDFREGPQHAGNGGADWEYFKLGLWMVNFYTSWCDYNLQLLFIPDFEQNRIPLRVLTGGHPWEFQFPRYEKQRIGYTGPAVPVLNSYKKPRDLTWNDSEAAARFGFIKKGWEVHFSYFYTWTDMPVPFNGGYLNIPSGPTLVFKDVRHTRIHQLGFNYEKQFYFPNWDKGIIFKGEGRYDINPFYETDDPRELSGFEQHNTWVLAVPNIQWTMEPLWTFAARIDTRIIEGYHHGLKDLPLQMDARRVKNDLTLAAIKWGFNNRLFVFSHVAWDWNHNGLWAHSTWNWDFTDKVKGQVEFNIYEGRNTLAGEFSHRSNVTVGLEYRFD